MESYAASDIPANTAVIYEGKTAAIQRVDKSWVWLRLPTKIGTVAMPMYIIVDSHTKLTLAESEPSFPVHLSRWYEAFRTWICSFDGQRWRDRSIDPDWLCVQKRAFRAGYRAGLRAAAFPIETESRSLRNMTAALPRTPAVVSVVSTIGEASERLRLIVCSLRGKKPYHYKVLGKNRPRLPEAWRNDPIVRN